MMRTLRMWSGRCGITAVRRPVLALGLAVGVMGLGPVQAAPAVPALEVQAPGQVQDGQPIVLRLIATGMADVAGFELRLRYDPAVLEYSGQRWSPDLQRLGRDVAPLSPVQSAEGLAIGLASCPFDRCVRPQGSRRARGGAGRVDLAQVSLTPQVRGTVDIQVEGVRLVAADGTPVSAMLPVQTVTVHVGDAGSGTHYTTPAPRPRSGPHDPAGAAGPYDLTGDGEVNQADLLRAELAWAVMRRQGDPCGVLSDPAADANHDGCVDIVDLQLIAHHYDDPGAGPRRGGGGRPAEGTERLAAAGLTLTVTSTGDGGDANPGDGVCATGGGACTLRAALEEANLAAGPSSIGFAIPGSGVHTIAPSTPLPALNNPRGGITIDGYTQPGAVPNTAPLGSNAVLRVELQGPGEGESDWMDGLTVLSGDNTIRGLAIYRFKNKVYVYGAAASNNTIAGNFIGTNAAATYQASAEVYAAAGVDLETQPAGNRIGTPAPADRNVIAGNAFIGVNLNNQSHHNVIQNNIIGLAPQGDRGLGNLWIGLAIHTGSHHNIVGGLGSGERNVASGNLGGGMKISHPGSGINTGNELVGNYIGTDLTGTIGPAYAANQNYGVFLWDGAQQNTVRDNIIGNNTWNGIYSAGYQTGQNRYFNNWVGVTPNGVAMPNGGNGVNVGWGSVGEQIGPNNRIANNALTGVLLESDAGPNTVTQNAIYNNGANGQGQGISLRWWYTNAHIQPPVLTSATTAEVRGTACGGCAVEVYRAERLLTDSTGGTAGQGKTYLGTGTAGTNGEFSVAVGGLSGSEWVTATMTDAAGNTSAFAINLQAAQGTGPTPTPTATATATPTPSPTATPTAPATEPRRVNAGGQAYTDSNGQRWSADTGFVSGTTWSTNAVIAGTSDPPLYQTQRYGHFTYSFAVPNGSYTVTLKFVEPYWTQAGSRVFNVTIEDQPVLTNFDILTQTAPNTALDRSFTATVTDGMITIGFTGTVDYAIIAAIQIAPNG